MVSAEICDYHVEEAAAQTIEKYLLHL